VVCGKLSQAALKLKWQRNASVEILESLRAHKGNAKDIVVDL
jgi:hypothetical protein